MRGFIGIMKAVSREKIINQTQKSGLVSLTGLVRLIPGWVPANLITVLRALLLIPIYIAYQHSSIVWLIVLFLLAWLTDIVDGLHARYRHQVSAWGKLLDPAVDKIFVVAILLLIGPGRLSPYVIFASIGLEAVLILERAAVTPLLARRKGFHYSPQANIFGKIKMFLQGLALFVLISGLHQPLLQTSAEVILWCAALLAAVSIISYLPAGKAARGDNVT
jgi:CDP-diacylglycerol--glycerol-3-phosphate 3-phosphatidyltransferase